jgi:SAM-dependent methyltransferase
MATSTNETYIYSPQWEQERARLSGLSASFDRITIRHLTAAGVGTGWHCLEVGAGAGSVARWLAAATGPTGRVVATDLDVRFLGDLGPPVEVVQHDVTGDPLEEHAFDLVHARAVVEHVPDRPAVIAKLVRALRPGGVLLLEDVVFGGPGSQLGEKVTGPPAAAGPLVRVIDAVAAGFRAIGADPQFGLELPGALRAAGLRDVEAELTYRLVYGGSPESAFYELSLHQLAERLIGAGLLAAEDWEMIGDIVTDPDAHWLSIGLASVSGRAVSDR